MCYILQCICIIELRIYIGKVFYKIYNSGLQIMKKILKKIQSNCYVVLPYGTLVWYTPVSYTHLSLLVQDMLTERITELSSSAWSSPVVKKYSGLCFCVDYRRLNDVMKKDCYPLPRIDNRLDTLFRACLLYTSRCV